MTIKETELPETIFALEQYIRYADNAIINAKSLIRKMSNRIRISEEKIDELKNKQEVTEIK